MVQSSAEEFISQLFLVPKNDGSQSQFEGAKHVCEGGTL